MFKLLILCFWPFHLLLLLVFLNYAYHAFPAICCEETHWQDNQIDSCCISSKFYCVYLSLECTCNWRRRVWNEQMAYADFYGLNCFFFQSKVCGTFSQVFLNFSVAKQQGKKAKALLLKENQPSKSNESVDGWLLSKCTSCQRKYGEMRMQKAFLTKWTPWNIFTAFCMNLYEWTFESTTYTTACYWHFIYTFMQNEQDIFVNLNRKMTSYQLRMCMCPLMVVSLLYLWASAGESHI